MFETRALVWTVALATLLAACSGGGEEQQAAADPAASTAPAIDDVTTLDGTQFASFTGTAAAGKLVFAQCRACHVTDAGVNRTGPSMAGIIGLKAGTIPGYNYSPANLNSGIIWTQEKMFQYLEKPQRVIPKTKMIFAGLPDAQKRADLIAYLAAPE